MYLNTYELPSNWKVKDTTHDAHIFSKFEFAEFVTGIALGTGALDENDFPSLWIYEKDSKPRIGEIEFAAILCAAQNTLEIVCRRHVLCSVWRNLTRYGTQYPPC